MKKWINLFFAYLARVVFKLRYRIIVNELSDDMMKPRNPNRGTLFLSNHPTLLIDPAILYSILWPDYQVRFTISAYYWYKPGISRVFRLLNGIPIPRFSVSSNSYKRHKTEEAVQTVIDGLIKGENFVIYPAGIMKTTAYESIAGVSGVQRIIESVPDANIVLVRVKGLWGSSFSNYYSVTATLRERAFLAIKTLLKNFIFFTPRRNVIVDLERPAEDFIQNKSRTDLNKVLEQWFNRPDGLSVTKEKFPGDSLMLVPYLFWDKRKDKLIIEQPKEAPRSTVVSDELIAEIPGYIKDVIVQKLAELSKLEPATITPEKRLSEDLSLDSLDIAELVSFLYQEFSVTKVPIEEMTTVGKLMMAATGKMTYTPTQEEPTFDLLKWNKSSSKVQLGDLIGTTIPEVFLNRCNISGNAIACADVGAGIFTYAQLKVRVLLLADILKNYPGEYIGILLPASITTTVVIIACQLAGKVPLMINWTIGPRHLKAVRELSNLQVVLTSWQFIDRLENANLEGIEDCFILLENVRDKIHYVDKAKASIRSKYSTEKLLNLFAPQGITPDSPAVLLFTSGSEGMPKGVPLTHRNLLKDIEGCLKQFDFYSDDVAYEFLPPFHSFGFLLSMINFVSGVRFVYSPDPTDGQRLAKGIKKWGVSIIVSAPVFLVGIFKSATEDQLKTLRLCISGAEAAPRELLHLLEKFKKSDLLAEGYGITECSPVVTANRLSEKRKGVGKAIPGVVVIVVDREKMTPLAANQEGLILCRGESVFSGYINAETASPFVTVGNQQWYNTGDIGSLDEEGYLTISGRLKRFVKIGGEMVSLPALEKVLEDELKKSGKFAEDMRTPLAVLGDESTDEKTQLILCTPASLTLEEVNLILNQAGFSNLLKISSIFYVPSLPLQGSGKINYRELQDKWVVNKTLLATKATK